MNEPERPESEANPSHEASLTPASPAEPPAQENIWLNLAFNIFIPVVLLKKAPAWFGFSPAISLVVALAFPVTYFIYDMIRRGKVNFFSILGFVSVLLTGGIGLLELPTYLYAVKEAAIPLMIGLVVLGSMFTRKPLVQAFLMNRSVMDVDMVERELDQRNTRAGWMRLLRNCTGWLAFSFFVSAVLNYVLAKWIVQSETGTDAFNSEVGTMQFWSFIIIMIPCMAIMMFIFFRLSKGIRQLAGLEMEEVFWATKEQHAVAKAAAERKKAEGEI